MQKRRALETQLYVIPSSIGLYKITYIHTRRISVISNWLLSLLEYDD